MNRMQAQNEIRKIANRKDLIITGERGEWYVDSARTDYLERRVRGCKSLASLVRNVRVAIDADCFER